MPAYTGPLEQVGPCQWRIPKSYRDDMRVDGLIFADDVLIEQIRKDQGPEQVANVATLPGIQKASLAMPDIHWGYGFCIGGVAATDPEEGGVISPGGVGYDINCGVRLLRTNLHWNDVKGRIRPTWSTSSSATSPPASARAGRSASRKPELARLMEQGVQFVVDAGLGTEQRPRAHRGRRLARRRRPGPGQRPGLCPGRRPVRHARLGQPLSRSPGRRRDPRRRGRRGDGACTRAWSP